MCSLVVLAWRQGDDGLAVGDGQHADFLSVEPLFNHDLVAGGAELALAADPLDRIQGFLASGADDHPLPAAKPSALTTTGTSSRSLR